MNTGKDSSSILKNKRIMLCITASIAAYKAAYICSRLIKLGAEVFPVLTPNATKFISSLTLSSISGKKTIIDQFENEDKIYHISIPQSCDAILVAPASANTISKIASGICDNFLTTAILASECPVLIAPAMNEVMFENPLIQNNIRLLKNNGRYFIINPEEGRLACGSEGRGRLAPEESIIEALEESVSISSDLKGKTVLVSAGGTVEYIDSVRFISNRSSGKMGLEVAKEAYFRGAKEVVLVMASGSLIVPSGIKNIKASSSAEMLEKLLKYYEYSDITVMAAAVSDIIPQTKYDYKLKKNDDIISKLKFAENINILSILAEKKREGQYLVGFSAESGENIENTKNKMRGKNIDMIVLNDISREDIGFESERNEVIIIPAKRNIVKSKRDKKRIIARLIWNEIIKDL
ncbi:MAG: bifunctional phosphopantothenoylcysteine decarboxylase/phosphopantothenate--cysteine ligase CoaBC [Actinobacteria bacterium]|nr:bifunctional phosphopantothenoylcysteine decarboxylase/phosphopantothenate--cysteine ligase CoaBC [Actinomycetota bacterium]